MSLFRLAILLGLLAYFVPLDEADTPADGSAAVSPFAALDAAQATFSDVTQFCDRNETVCDTGRDVATVMALKAKAGARMVADYFDTPGSTEADTGVIDSRAAEMGSAATQRPLNQAVPAAIDQGVVGSVSPGLHRQIDKNTAASSHQSLSASGSAAGLGASSALAGRGLLAAPMPRPKPWKG